MAQSWRKSPFIPGRNYRVRHDFKAFRDSFKAGEVLTFEEDTYSAYHGYTGYSFSQPSNPKKRIWDVHDDDFDTWQDLFEEVE